MSTNITINRFAAGKNLFLNYVSNKGNLQQMAKITSILLSSYYIIHRLYTGFFGPLAKLPGSFLTRFLISPSFFLTVFNGKRYELLHKLHDQYGHIVRLGPNMVSVSDKFMVKQVLVTDDLKKAPFYDGISMKASQNLFSTRDKDFHKQRRRIVSPAFSIKYLNSLEPFMISVTESLIKKIGKQIENTKNDDFATIDIWNLYQCLALDVIGETAFGQTFEMVENNSHFITKAIAKEMEGSAVNSISPLFAKLFMQDATRINPELEQFVRDIINHRMESPAKQRKDILQWLINSQKAIFNEDRLTADAIISETLLILIAGSETTSNTLGFVIYQLLRCPDKLQKLYNEIDQLTLDEGQKLFTHDQLKHLPYLNGVINETLRLDVVAAGGLGRITTEKTVLGGQYVLPKDIIVIANFYHTQTSADYWENPKEFIPERWLNDQHDIKPADSEAFYPFSSGSRNCIGKNFALQEMRLSLSALLKYYEILPIEQEMKDAEERRAYITLGVAKNSFKIIVKRRE
ncbi:cytochrome P450 [Backusella circina FSU 941]|nr:cytochrome P450 [Backusella circina FSU 941]